MAKSLMIQGTGSGAGKSLIVAGLCRIFRDMGINVAPFKAQNMALNSFITKEGGEIGRAQALQAEAAGVEPSTDMNPILLKASGEAGCQVVVNGRVHSNMKATEYYSFKKEAWMAVTQAYERLSKKHDLIVIEGAGSPAEINLSDDEIVNMRVARYTNAPVILVGDIDKGGVFASIYGTVELLKERINPPSPPFVKGGMGGFCDADYIKAYIINKFRGDRAILNPGLQMIHDRTGRPVIGVIPYVRDIGLHEEDGLSLEGFKGSSPVFNTGQGFKGSKIKIVVVQLRCISNFTDFDPFLYEPDVELLYSLWEGDIENADLVIIPGSKNTVKDLLFLRENGIEESIKRAVKKGIQLIGICGGYQMLGEKILDPFSAESSHREVKGLGLLDIETTFEKIKTTCQVEAELINDREIGRHGAENSPFLPFPVSPSHKLRGYEIHMGMSKGDIGLFKLKRLSAQSKEHSPPAHPSPSRGEGKGGVHPHTLQRCGGEGLGSGFYALESYVLDGSLKGNIWGTYIHGIFDNDRFRRGLINSLRIRKGLMPIEEIVDYSRLRDDALNKWAKILKENIDMKFIEGLLRG